MCTTPRYSLVFCVVTAALSLTLVLGRTQRAAAEDLPGDIQPRVFLPSVSTWNTAPAAGVLQDTMGPDDYVEQSDDSGQAGAIGEGANEAPGTSETPSAGTTYYVDCAEGNDANSGQSLADAWLTLTQANKATLNPGDQLLLKRGCTFPALLDARWFGTAAEPILIGAYGTGPLPIIQNPDAIDVRITGAHLILENLHATGPDASLDCAAQPLTWKVGFEFIDGAEYNTLRNSKASHNAVGIRFSYDAHHNHILRNTITDNNLIWEIYQGFAQGAKGIQLHGDSQEIAYNYFTNNQSICAYYGNYEHISIELYAATNALIHHNVSYDRNFAELGSSFLIQSANNTFAYNLHIASDYGSDQGARFLITRGWGHKHGPVLNTLLLHNTVYLTGRDSKGVSCWPCGPDILTLRDNILWVDPEPFSANESFVESHNLYWSSNGTPLLNWRNGFAMSPTSKVADPKFVDPANGNFSLSDDSPARDAGTLEALPAELSYDLGDLPVPIGSQADIGAYEYFVDPWRLTTLPGRIEAEDYKAGGEGVGYHDTAAKNIGAAYRQDGVDIQPTRDVTGTYNVGWIAAREWMAYEISVPTSGAYRIVARVAAPLDNSRFRLEVDDVDITGSVVIPATGGWQIWADVPVNVSLDYGRHTLRFFAETRGLNLNYLDVAKN